MPLILTTDMTSIYPVSFKITCRPVKLRECGIMPCACFLHFAGCSDLEDLLGVRVVTLRVHPCVCMHVCLYVHVRMHVGMQLKIQMCVYVYLHNRYVIQTCFLFGVRVGPYLSIALE